MKEVEIAVAIPGSDERQEVESLRFEPDPREITVDGWGQRTAHFQLAQLPAGGEAEVTVTAAVILHELEWRITDRDVGPRAEIPASVVRQYLRDGDNYRLDDGLMKAAAHNLGARDASLIEEVRQIHDFVVDALEYDRDDRWDPADSVLRRGKGSCSEYCYLMIALCRLRGIPARYAGGSWLDERTGAEVDRVFHRWVEVYLPRVGWFPVDPTRDDEAAKDGKPYRFFGRLPWRYFVMSRGDGDRLEGGRLGWEYRSSLRWRDPMQLPPGSVIVDRYARWSRAPEVATTTRGAAGSEAPGGR
jgi:transglutaminase-like putative cysteine protease